MDVVATRSALLLVLFLSATTASAATGKFTESITPAAPISTHWGGDTENLSGDFDGDGRLDLFTREGSKLWVRRSIGSGFTEELWNPYQNPTLFKWGGIGWAWVGDVNGDGKSDIVTGVSGTEIWVYVSTGTGFNQVQWSATSSPSHWGGSAAWNFTGDFDGDGRMDIASGVGGQIWVHRSTGSSFVDELWSDPNVPAKWGGSPAFNWAADFDGDGKTDIASVVGVKIVVHHSTGSFLRGFLEEAWPSTPEDPHWSPSAGWNFVGDFDGDGRADILSVVGSGEMWMHRSTGSGFSEEHWLVSFDPPLTGLALGGEGWAWAADFNGDGRSELAVRVSSNIYVLRRTLNYGMSGFVEEQWCSSCPNWGTNTAWNWIGDHNGDGRADIITANQGTVPGKCVWVIQSSPQP